MREIKLYSLYNCHNYIKFYDLKHFYLLFLILHQVHLAIQGKRQCCTDFFQKKKKLSQFFSHYIIKFHLCFIEISKWISKLRNYIPNNSTSIFFISFQANQYFQHLLVCMWLVQTWAHIYRECSLVTYHLPVDIYLFFWYN